MLGALKGHIARWDHRLELLAQGAPIDVVGAFTTTYYMSWFLSIARQWMTPRGFIVASQYAPIAPINTQFVWQPSFDLAMSSPFERLCRACSLAHSSSTSYRKLLRRHQWLPARSKSRLLLMTFIWRRWTCPTSNMVRGPRNLGHRIAVPITNPSKMTHKCLLLS
ncbi:unnamed protein product [Amaranthus hypochondriacus]